MVCYKHDSLFLLCSHCAEVEIYCKLETVNRKINTSKLKELILEQGKTTEHTVTIAYNEPNPEEWGGTSPFVTLEYDNKHLVLLEILIQYKQREVGINLVLTMDELK